MVWGVVLLKYIREGFVDELCLCVKSIDEIAVVCMMGLPDEL